MALPKLDIPIYTLKIPSSGKEISYRPFLVKEEKILLMAMEGGDENEITTAIKQIINNCVLGFTQKNSSDEESIDVDTLPLFDIEYILLNLRARSTGDVIQTRYTRKNCPQEDCKPIEISIDVNSIEIMRNKDHNKKIQITNDVGIIMKYPDINVTNGHSGIKQKNDSKRGFDLILKCVDKIYDNENVYNKSDYTPEELQEFIEGFSKDQFQQVENFFETMPVMYKDIEFNCEKCGHKEETRLEGLASFFG